MKKIVLFLLVGFWWANALAQDFKIVAMKSSVAEELFQTYLIVEALKELGYKTDGIKELDYPIIYKAIAQKAKSKDVSFLVSNWAPLQDNMLKGAGEKNFYRKGGLIRNCAQGYLIDKKTADKYKIKYFNDLKNPKIAKLFDADGDGKADLAGPDSGWGASSVVEYQLDAFGLRKTVEHNQGRYAAIIAQTIARFKNGKPILYYTWSPYWISGKLVPGKDVVWLQVKKTAHPVLKDTTLPNGANYGFSVNTQHILANASVEKFHPDIAKLFELIEIPVGDVSAQNMLIIDGKNKEEDIKSQTKAWIKAHQKEFDEWIKQAKKAK